MEGAVPALLLHASVDITSLDSFLSQLHLPDRVKFSLETAKYSDVALCAFLKNTFLHCPKPPLSTFNWPSKETPVSSMRELVQLAISIHLNSIRFRPHRANVLCLGYRHLAGEQAGSFVKESLGVESYYPNGLLSHLLTREWERLLTILGGDLVMHLLTGAVIIVRRSTGSLLQVVGPPITDICPIKKSPTARKSSMIIRCHQMLYTSHGAPWLKGGLPFKHPLNRSKASHKIQSVVTAMFRIPATCKNGRIRHILLDFAMSLIKRHQRCPYRHLYEYHCADFDTPILVPPTGSKGSQETFIWKNAIRSEKVTAFIKAILIRLLAPSELLRSLSPLRHIINVVQNILEMRRRELIDVKYLMKGLSTKETWLLISNGSKHSVKHWAKEEAEALRTVIMNFVMWILNELVIPLIKVWTLPRLTFQSNSQNNFYVTESSLHRNRLLMFRRDRWKSYLDHELGRLVKDGFLEPLTTHALQNPRPSLEVNALRFIPKDVGFRPIIHAKHQPFKERHPRSSPFTSHLHDVHAVLDYYRQNRPDSMGASIICMKQVHERLHSFKSSSNFTSYQPLFMVKVDLKSCFDNIPHNKLLQVIRDLLDAPCYMVRRYETIHLVHGQFKRRFRRAAHPVDDILAPPEGSRGGLLMDRTVGHRLDRLRIIRLIEEHVTCNIVRASGSLYRQKVGIPQGSILSTLLCSFFYADLDRMHLARFIKNPRSLLMRFVDDMLFVSPEKKLVDEFIELLKRGFPDYGAIFNVSKTAANFSHSLLPPSKIHPSAPFPWCGLLLDPVNLKIMADYGKLLRIPIADSLCINYADPSPADRLARHLHIYMKPKLHPLFLDASLNDHDLFTISANIYRHALVVAIKSHIYRQDLRRVTGLSINNERLLRDVRELSKYVERKVRALCKIPILHGSSLARKLVLRAFLEVWKSKSTSYHGAIVELEGSCNDEELEDLVDKGLCKRVLAMGMAFMEKAQF